MEQTLNTLNGSNIKQRIINNKTTALERKTTPGPENINFFMLNRAEHEIYPANKC